MSDDIVERLRLQQCCVLEPKCIRCEKEDAVIAEIERLKQWRTDVLAVLDEWEAVFDKVYFGRDEIGLTKASIVAGALDRKDAEIERLKAALRFHRRPDLGGVE